MKWYWIVSVCIGSYGLGVFSFLLYCALLTIACLPDE